MGQGRTEKVMEKKEAGTGEGREGRDRREKRRATSELPKPGRLARLELFGMCPGAAYQPGNVHSALAIVAVPSLSNSLVRNPESLPFFPSRFHPPPPFIQYKTPGRITRRKKKITPIRCIPLLIPSHHHTHQPPPPLAPRNPKPKHKRKRIPLHPNRKSQNVRKRRKERGKITYGLTLIRFSSAPSWSGMMISHSVFSWPASFCPSLPWPVALVVVVVVDILR